MCVSCYVVILCVLQAVFSGHGQNLGPAYQASKAVSQAPAARAQPEPRLDYISLLMELVNAPFEETSVQGTSSKIKRPGVESLMQLTPSHRQQIAALPNIQGNVGPELDKIFPPDNRDPGNRTVKNFVRNLHQLSDCRNTSGQPPCESADCKQRLKELDTVQAKAAEVFKGITSDPNRLKNSVGDFDKNLKHYMAKYLGGGKAPFIQQGEDCFQDVDHKELAARIQYQGHLSHAVRNLDKTQSDWARQEANRLEEEAHLGLTYILEGLHRGIMMNTEKMNILMENLANMKRPEGKACQATCGSEDTANEATKTLITSEDKIEPAFVEKSFILETKDKPPEPRFLEKNFILETKDQEEKNSTIITSMDIINKSKPIVPEEKSFILETRDKQIAVAVRNETKDLLVETKDKNETEVKAENVTTSMDETEVIVPCGGKDDEDIKTEVHHTEEKQLASGKRPQPGDGLRSTSKEGRQIKKSLDPASADSESPGTRRLSSKRAGRQRQRFNSQGRKKGIAQRRQEEEDGLGALVDSLESRLGLDDSDLLFSLTDEELGLLGIGNGGGRRREAKPTQTHAAIETSADAVDGRAAAGHPMPQFVEKIFLARSEDDDDPVGGASAQEI